MRLSAAFLLLISIHAVCWQSPVSQPPETAESHLGKGYEALKQDQYDIAAGEFKAALALDPSLAQRARFPLAVALFEMHQNDEARREFDSLQHEVGHHPNIVYYLGRLDLDGGDYASAIRNLSEAAAKPPFPDTAYHLGFAFFKQGDLKAAEKWLKNAAEQTPRDSRVQYQLARVYREQGRNEEAKKAQALSEELRLRDANDSQLKLECTQRLEQGPPEQAHATCERLFDPSDARALTGLGMIYGQHGQLQDALRCFRRAAELEPRSPQMQYNLAFTYYQLNQFTEARLPLEEALKRWPDLFQLNALYGAVLAKLREDAAAYHALRRAHELNPQDSGTATFLYAVTLDLARESEKTRDYAQSLRYLREAATLQPADPEPHRRMAEVYSLTADAAQATAEQQEADRLGKNAAP